MIGSFERPGSVGSCKPYSKNATELFIRVRQGIYTVLNIIKLISDHNASLTNFNMHIVSQDEYSATMILEFDYADCTSDELINQIKELRDVIQLEVHNVEGRLFGQFGYPLLVMERYRAIIIRTTPLLQIEHRLTESFGTAGPAIMFEEGKAYASAVVDQYIEALQDAERTELLSHIADGWHATGWGTLNIRQDANDYYVTLSDSPVFYEPKIKESRFLYGMVAGIILKVFGKDTVVISSYVDVENKKIELRLRSSNA
ncbi:MAG: hypothetical protein QXV84_04810 [Conexivisphaerales archaeon]